MSEDSTTPPESSSHGSDSPEEPKVPAATSTDAVSADPAEAEVSAAEPVRTKAAAGPSPKREPIPVAVEVAGTQQTFKKALKLAKDAWVKAQPILQEKSTQALLGANRFTNYFLDQTWPKLTAQAIAAIPDSTKAKIEAQKAKLQPTLDKLKPLWTKGIVPLWQKVIVPAWMKGLALLRQRLSANLQVLTDRFLTVAILTTVVLVYWIFSALTAGTPAAAKQPSVPTKPVLTRPVPNPITQRPVVKPSSSPSIAAKPSVPKVSSPKPIAPAVQPSVAVTPKAIPSPEIDLAEIKTQLSNAVAGMGEALIASVSATGGNQTLKVSLGPDWEHLSPPQQETVAQKLWEKAQKLQFDQFDLRLDSTNVQVARSPVVGSNVILLQRPVAAEAA